MSEPLPVAKPIRPYMMPVTCSLCKTKFEVLPNTFGPIACPSCKLMVTTVGEVYVPPMSAKSDSVAGQTFMGWFLWVGGILGIVASFSMRTSVPSGTMYGEVNNLGLVADKLFVIIVSCASCIAGSVWICAGDIVRSLRRK